MMFSFSVTPSPWRCPFAYGISIPDYFHLFSGSHFYLQTHKPFSVQPTSISPSVMTREALEMMLEKQQQQQQQQRHNNGGNKNPQLIYVTTKRRKFTLSIPILLLTSSVVSLPITAKAAEDQHLVLENYSDTNEGFTLLRPSSWNKVDKAGATVLFQDPNKGTNNLGVVVSPVWLSSLGEFGSPEFVADKLIQAEKRKESTKDAMVVGVGERLGSGGLQVYEFEYKLDSTRGGMKRIFSAAFVASKKLYLLNIAHSDAPETPLDASTRMVLEQSLHSFGTTQSK